MYSHTAYEAFYIYLGLALQGKITEIIVSEAFFRGVILMTFAVMFLLTTFRFFSRYLPQTLVERKPVPLSKFLKVVVFLFLGISLLKMGTDTKLLSYSNRSWHDNAYVEKNINSSSETYRVSYVFDVLSRTGEEVAHMFSRVIDKLMSRTHSQLEAPNFFYKAVLFSSSATIDNPEIKAQIGRYTENCLDQVLPLMNDDIVRSKLDGFFFGSTSALDEKLDSIDLESRGFGPLSFDYTCLDLKDELRDNFINYSFAKNENFLELIHEGRRGNPIRYDSWRNLHSSNLLVNHFLDQKEVAIGIQKGSQLPTTGGRVTQYLSKVWGFDTILSLFGKSELHGVGLAAKRSQEFSELLTRAPHLQGAVKLFLIACFPLLVFAIVGGKWKWLVYWFAAYTSVLLWTPIWTLLYHIVTNIHLATGTMEDFGRLYDGISLYSAKVLSSRIYYMYTVYSWLQIILGPLFTGLCLYFMRPMLSDTQGDQAPESIGDAVNVGTKVVGMV
jgi:hypothetical protein